MIKSTTEEFIKHHIDNKITDYNNPHCVDCNECCGGLTQISDKELKKFKKLIKKDVNVQARIKQYKKLVQEHLKNGDIYLMCPFSKPTSKRCAIYKDRPEICRKFHCKKELNKQTERPVATSKTHVIIDLLKD